MTLGFYKKPTISSIVLGILAFLVLLIGVGNLDDIVKWVGTPFMVIPSSLGWIDMVKPSEVINIETSQSPNVLNFTRPGRYAVYTADYDYLMISDMLAEANAPPWLKVTDQATGAQATVTFISRALMPYDTPFAKGRAIMSIEIKSPGRYTIESPRRPAVISIVHDVTTGKETLITVLMLIQVIFIVLPFGIRYYRHYQTKREVLKAMQVERRAASEVLWNALRKGTKKNEDEKIESNGWDI